MTPIESKLNDFHIHIIKEIIDFCIENNIDADYVSLSADHLKDSIEYKKWHPGTDSSLTFFDENEKSIICSM